MRSLLRSPGLRRILAAYTVNRLGTWFGFVALSIAVFDHTHSALAVAALLIAGQALPAFVAPALVARVEASDRRGRLSALYLAEAVTAAALAVLLWHFSLPAVLVLVTIDGTAALAASALLRAAVARTAREEAPDSEQVADERNGDGTDAGEQAERRANAAINVAFSVTFVIGPALAGVVVAAAGASTALLVDVASFVICGAMLLDVRAHVEEAGVSVRRRLAVAWHHINQVPALRRLLWAQAVALVFFESAAPIEVAYAKATLHSGDHGYGLLLALWGLGVVAGSLVFAKSLHRSLTVLLAAGTLGVGLAYLGWAAAPSLATACGAALVGGMGNGVQWASLISGVQRLTPGSLQGRLMGAVESIGAICPAIGLSLGGALVAISSPRVAFLAVGIGASLMTCAFLTVRFRSEPATNAGGHPHSAPGSTAVAAPRGTAQTTHGTPSKP